MEIQQRFSHVCGIHYMPERKAWCRLDRHGDIEEVVQVVSFAPENTKEGKNEYGGRIVLFNPGCS